MRKKFFFLLIILATISICWCVYRDIRIEKQYTGDLRNRIVGARLQKDRKAPYFYKWKSSDGLRYYDPNNFDTLKVSNITATPFLHQLLYPIADLPQREISKIWLAIEYLLLLIITLLALSFSKTNQQKQAVIVAAALFLFSTAWTGHIAVGQVYILVPFFAFLFSFFINRKDNLLYAALAGLTAATLLLIRPTTIFFILPFLFFFRLYKPQYLTVLFSALVVTFIFAFANTQNRLYWKEYRKALKEQLKSHQSMGATVQTNEPDPGYQSNEGWDKKEIANEYSAFPYNYNQEHGNVFVIVNHALKTKIPVWTLGFASLLLMALIVFFFYRQNIHSNNISLFQVSTLAFLLYMLADIFSPIHRFLYNGVQWLFPIFLIAAGFEKKYRWIYAGILTGIVSNSINLSFVPMENTLGEYIIFLSILVFIFKYKPATGK